MMQPRHAPAVQRAADEGHADVLKQLVKAGATPPALSLAICALRGQASVVQYLLSVPGHGPELDDALYYAVSGQHVHIAAALLEARADPNHSFGSSSVLMAAIGRGLPPSATRAGAAEAATRLLLGARARVDVCDGDGASPLMLAAQQGHPRVVELVLAAGGDVHARNGAQSVLSYARGTDVVRVLLQAGAAVDPPGCESVLTPACRHGDAKTVKLLLAAKADLRGLSAAGQPLLHVAVQTQADAAEEAQLETVRLLLSSRAPVQPAAGGASALHLCAAQADALSERVAPLLLAREPEALEYVNEAGQTPLMLLLLAPATLPSQRLLQSLLAARADVDARDRRGCTPLFYAVADVGGAPRWKSYVWPLLRAGADPDFQDNEGLTVAGRLEARGVVHVDSVRATSHTGTDVEAVAQPDAATAQARDEAVQEVLRAIALERARPSTAEAIERRRMGLSAEASSCCCIS
jgi:ankyrin repeat protein